MYALSVVSSLHNLRSLILELSLGRVGHYVQTCTYVIIRYLVRENREPLIYKVGQRLPRWCFEKAGVYWLLHVHANVEDVREQC